MAPNLTLPNMVCLESPVDLTVPCKSKCQTDHFIADLGTIKLSSMPMITSHPGLSENVTSLKKASLKDKFRVDDFNELREEKMLNEASSIGRHGKTEKCKLQVARRWLAENLFETKQAVLAIYSLLAAYSVFCRKIGEQPLSEASFFDIISTEFSEHLFDNTDDATSPRKRSKSCPKSSTVQCNQKRKHYSFAFGESESVAANEKRQKSMDSVSQLNSKQKVSSSKHVSVEGSEKRQGNVDDSSKQKANRSPIVKVSVVSEDKNKILDVDVATQHGRLHVSSQGVQPLDDVLATKKQKLSEYSKILRQQLAEHSEQGDCDYSLKDTLTFKDEKDSDSSDSGCEETEPLKLKGNHDNQLPEQEQKCNKANLRSHSGDKCHERNYLEIDNWSYDSGLDVNEYDLDSNDCGSEKHYDSDLENTKIQNKSTDSKNTKANSERSLSSNEIEEYFPDDGESGTLLIDESDDNIVPKPIKIKEEISPDIELLSERNKNKYHDSAHAKSQTFLKNSQQKVISKVIERLSLHEFSDAKCYLDAKKLSEVFELMLKNDILSLFLKTFGHSMSCRANQCTKLCIMFKRICKHLMSALSHKCAVKHIYGHILRLHIDTCSELNCGITDCKILKNKRREFRTSVFALRD